MAERFAVAEFSQNGAGPHLSNQKVDVPLCASEGDV